MTNKKKISADVTRAIIAGTPDINSTPAPAAPKDARSQLAALLETMGEAEARAILQGTERKTRRVNMTLRPSLYDRAQGEAEKKGKSFTEIVEDALEEYLDRRGL